jgi:hypothetical protein
MPRRRSREHQRNSDVALIAVITHSRDDVIDSSVESETSPSPSLIGETEPFLERFSRGEHRHGKLHGRRLEKLGAL